MDLDETVINSCRVCQTPNQDGDFESLYEESTEELSVSGILYEELLGSQIDIKTAGIYPQYLCNSCDLQMRLFKKLKTKARKTLETLNARFEVTIPTLVVQQDDEHEECVIDDFKTETIASKLEVLDELDIDDFQLDVKTNEDEPDTEFNLDDVLQLQQITTIGEDNACYRQLLDDTKQDASMGLIDELDDFENEYEKEPLEDKSFADECNLSEYATDEFELIEEGLNPIKQGRQIVVECDLLEILNENSQATSTSTAVMTDEYIDVHYLEDELDDSKTTKDSLKKTGNKPANQIDKNNFCRVCNKIFLNKSDLIKHRKEFHSTKYPCVECGKVFQTSNAHKVHMNIHLGQPAYQCELCNKTFNQKVHFTYHMDKHNNIRNFKCDTCGKAFIGKGDLVIHTRTHTGERRYACDICQKEFLMHVHMRNHRYSHFEKEFECKVCQQKFVSPATLRTHMKSIHENEPRFQCEYCVKKFRRKHHLLAHHKVHRRIIEEEC